MPSAAEDESEWDSTVPSLYTHTHMHSTAQHTSCMLTHHTHTHTPLVSTFVQVNIDDPSVLLPKLPKPKDLQPFPVSEAIVSDSHME